MSSPHEHNLGHTLITSIRAICVQRFRLRIIHAGRGVACGDNVCGLVPYLKGHLNKFATLIKVIVRVMLFSSLTISNPMKQTYNFKIFL